MGWIGDNQRVMEALKANNAEKDEEGRFLIRNGNIVTFMGAGEEAVIRDGTECCIAGDWVPLIPMVAGGVMVLVI